uniref:DUF4283 domain-containing protein n=1 Tax=Tanacetum cinerariifolium TaxID=118510 RepID=A0A6L2LS88_TANCI|nr:hypothetical protein [Tanacetum cinerariifolium]
MKRVVKDPTAKIDKLCSLDDTTVLGSIPPLSTPVTTTAGNALGKSSYANVTSKQSRKKVNVHTLFTPEGNGIDVVVSVDSIRAISERFANTAYNFFLRNKVAYLVVANYKWHPDENLLKEDVNIVPVWVKLYGAPVTAFSEDGLSVIATKLEYRPILKKSTASSSGNKKKGAESTIEFSNSNPFDVLNSVDNDVEFGTDRGTTNLVNDDATSSGSSFMNVDNSSFGTTPIIEKIRKFEDLLTSGQAILVDKAGNLLKNVEFPGEYDSEDEVASDENDMACFMAYEKDLSHKLQAICDNLDIRIPREEKQKTEKMGYVGAGGDGGRRRYSMEMERENKRKESQYGKEWVCFITSDGGDGAVAVEQWRWNSGGGVGI